MEPLQGTITERGREIAESGEEIYGSIAIEASILNERTVRLKISVVDDEGVVLATWNGVDFWSGSRTSWMFPDGGKIVLKLLP